MNYCIKSVQIRSFFGPYFPVFGLNTRKYGLEKTLYLDTFHAVNIFMLYFFISRFFFYYFLNSNQIQNYRLNTNKTFPKKGNKLDCHIYISFLKKSLITCVVDGSERVVVRVRRWWVVMSETEMRVGYRRRKS